MHPFDSFRPSFRNQAAFAVSAVCLFQRALTRAHQCEYFDAGTAELFRAVIKPGVILLSYCEPCEMEAPEPAASAFGGGGTGARSAR